MRALPVLLLLAVPAAAQNMRLPASVIQGAGGASAGAAAAANPFADKFMSAMTLSLSPQPFYASRLLQAFDAHLAQVSTSRDAAQAAAYLRAEILGSEKAAPKGLLETLEQAWAGPADQARRFGEKLGTQPLPEKQAGALLLAGALARPEEFNEVLTRLEAAKPGMGKQLSRMLQNAGGTPGANPSAVAALRALGSRVGPNASGLTYNSKGRFDRFFDGAR